MFNDAEDLLDTFISFLETLHLLFKLDIPEAEDCFLLLSAKSNCVDTVLDLERQDVSGLYYGHQKTVL